VNGANQMSDPLVSIITIFLNAERFLEEAIASVFNQSYKNWELILVDDGSTDSSTRIALRYAQLHPRRVRSIENEGRQNRGMSAARNLGIRNSCGEYLAFLDADDIWLPQKLEQQVRIMQREPAAGMVYGATEYWWSWTGDESDTLKDFVPELGVAPDSLINPPHLLPVLLRNQIVTTTGALVRRTAVEQIGGFEERFRGLHEDQAFCAKVCLAAPVFVAGERWYRYRRHPDSCCSIAESSGEQRLERSVFLNWLETYLRQIGVADHSVWRALNKARWQSLHPQFTRVVDGTKYRARIVTERTKSAARRVLPQSAYAWLRDRRNARRSAPALGKVNFGDLRRLSPISRVFGFDRGTPIDRYYIEKFLAANAQDICGRVLEVGDNEYTRRFGGERVLNSDVLHVNPDAKQATIIADLTSADHIPSECFDCIILTQTLHLIYDVRAALATVRRILKPGGVLLATFPGISQIDHYDWGSSWYWSFTSLSAQRMFGEAFPGDLVTVGKYGNVLAATAFLQGLAAQELNNEELDYTDRDYEVTITTRVKKNSRP